MTDTEEGEFPSHRQVRGKAVRCMILTDEWITMT